MTPEEREQCLRSLREQTDAELQETARDFHVQDVAEGREALLKQLAPILVLYERCYALKHYLNDGDTPPRLLAVSEGEDGPERFGWLVDLDEVAGLLRLASLEPGAAQILIPFTFQTWVRKCPPPRPRYREMGLDIS